MWGFRNTVNFIILNKKMAPPTGIGRAVRNSVKQTRNYWCGALPRTEIPVNKASKSNIYFTSFIMIASL